MVWPMWSNGFGIVSVIGDSRSPRPAARMIADFGGMMKFYLHVSGDGDSDNR